MDLKMVKRGRRSARRLLAVARSSFVVAVCATGLGASVRADGEKAFVPRVDALNPGLTLLVCLDKVERGVLCGDDDARRERNAILRFIGEFERCGFSSDADALRGAPAWATVGVVGGLRGTNLAYARLLKFAGALFGFPEYYSRGARIEGRILKDGPVVFRDEAALPQAVRRYDRLMEESRRDLATVIRAGDDNGGGQFWNVRAQVFMYPPAFGFKTVEGAAAYRFQVVDDVHRMHAFDAATPHASLKPIWPELPAGFTTVSCRAYDAKGRELGLAGERRFWRSEPFDPIRYRPAARSFGDACRLLLDNLFGWHDVVHLEENGEPDVAKGTNFSSYPSKMQSAVVQIMLDIARNYPERKERALRIARLAADYLLKTRERPGSPLEGFTATYIGKGQLSGTYAGQHMLVYPALGGDAFLAMHEATGERKYLDAALLIGRTYLRLQGEDGTWHLKLNAKDGSPVAGNRLVPTTVMLFMENLFRATGDERFRVAGDRAFGSIDRGPLTDWDWEGQFEDIAPAERKYANLTKHMPCETAIYMLRRFPKDARRLAQAREILRFAEDQFVMWHAPCRPDGAGPWTPIYPFFSWRTPAVLEQYDCYSPIDASAAKLIRTYLALYEAEGKALDLAKAKALGASMVNNQDANGRIRTYWIPEPGDDDPLAGAVRLPRGGDWFNCMAADADALRALESAGL